MAMNEWSSAEYHAEQARQFYETGQWDKALAELKLALAVNPNHSDWHFGMGLILEAMHRYEEAVVSFAEVLRLRGDDVEAMLHQAEGLIRIGRHKRAIAVLEEVNRIDPDCEAGYCQRIAAYAHAGDHDQAEQMFYLAQQLTEQCPRCFDHVAYSLAARGDMDRAIWCWQKALKIEPTYPDATANLARAHWQREQLDLARHFFIQHLREEPGDVDVLLQFGGLLMETGRLNEAREKFHRALEQDPTVAEAHQQLGQLALLEGRLDGASAELEMADRLDPDKPGIHLGLAKISLLKGRGDLARTHLQAELLRKGHSCSQVLELARVLIEVRLAKQAVDLLSPLIDSLAVYPAMQGKRLAQAMLYRAVAWRSIGKAQASIDQCRKVIKISPDHGEAIHHLAQAYLHQGRLKRAGYWLRRATQLCPRDRSVRRLRYQLIVARVVRVVQHAFASRGR